MSRISRFTSFLDRFEELLEVDRARLKHELIAKVDRQFGVIRTKVSELKNRFGGRGAASIVRSDYVDHLADDPKMENVSLEECRREQQVATAITFAGPSTSSGRKRGSHSGPIPAKKRKSNPDNNNQTKKFVCKIEGCGQSFQFDYGLKIHERMHFGIKPFRCTWPNCGYSSVQRCDIVKHIRVIHFKLPAFKKEQQRLNIVDSRDPNDYVQVDNTQLVGRQAD